MLKLSDLLGSENSDDFFWFFLAGIQILPSLLGISYQCNDRQVFCKSCLSARTLDQQPEFGTRNNLSARWPAHKATPQPPRPGLPVCRKANKAHNPQIHQIYKIKVRPVTPFTQEELPIYKIKVPHANQCFQEELKSKDDSNLQQLPSQDFTLVAKSCQTRSSVDHHLCQESPAKQD